MLVESIICTSVSNLFLVRKILKNVSYYRKASTTVIEVNNLWTWFMFQKLQEGKSETSDLELPVERGVGVVLVEQHRSCSAVLEARNSHFVFSVLHKGFLLKFLHICSVSGSLGHAILYGGTHLQTNPLHDYLHDLDNLKSMCEASAHIPKSRNSRISHVRKMQFSTFQTAVTSRI